MAQLIGKDVTLGYEGNVVIDLSDPTIAPDIQEHDGKIILSYGVSDGVNTLATDLSYNLLPVNDAPVLVFDVPLDWCSQPREPLRCAAIERSVDPAPVSRRCSS